MDSRKKEGGLKEMLLDSEAVACGVKLCRPQVIAAYPITPQTHIVETLSTMVDSGELKSHCIKVESEMSVIGPREPMDPLNAPTTCRSKPCTGQAPA